eukprot:PhM_4_TR6673/c0_g1_i1/m.84902
MSQPNNNNITIEDVYKLLQDLRANLDGVQGELAQMKEKQIEQADRIGDLEDLSGEAKIDFNRQEVLDPRTWTAPMLTNELWRSHLVELLVSPALTALASSKEVSKAPEDRRAVRALKEALPELLTDYGDQKVRNPRQPTPACIKHALRDLQAIQLRHSCSAGAADSFLKTLQAKKVNPDHQEAVKIALEFARDAYHHDNRKHL